MVGVLGPLFRHTVRTQHGVTASAGQRRGDVEIRNNLRQAGSLSLVFDLSIVLLVLKCTSITHDRFGSSSHVQQNGLLSHPQDLYAPLRLAAQRKINGYRQQYADNQNISFLPAIMSTSTRGEFLRLLFLQAPPGDRDALHCRWNAIATQPIRLVPFQARCIPPVADEQSRTCGGQSSGITDQPQVVEGRGIVAAPVHAPSRAPLLLPLLISHNLPLPRVH